MLFRVFKITDAGTKPNSRDLMGLLIIQSDNGIFLVDAESGPQSAPRVLADGLVNTDAPPFFEFNMQDFKGHPWTINCDTKSADLIGGRWHNKKGSPHIEPDEEDNWTAKGAGSGTGTGDDDEARAASATY